MTYSIDSLKVLIVEDNEGDYIIIEDLLTEEVKRLNTIRAESLAQALDVLGKHKDFDVVLLDLSLPDASGEALVAKVIESATQIPVIVLTGYSDKSFGIKTLGWGVSDYLMKDDLQSLQLFKSISYGIERKKVYNQLAEEEQKYRTLFAHSPLPMWVYEIETLKFLSVNEATVNAYGYTREEFLSMTVLDFCTDEENQDFLHHIEQLKSGSLVSFSGLVKRKKKNGEIIDVEIGSNVIDYNGKKANLVLANDVTEKLKAQNSLRESEEQLRTLNAELESRVAERTKDLAEAYQQLETFSYSISHDLQSPLRSIMGFAQLLSYEAKEKLSADGITNVEYIISSAKKMSNLIKDLLAFSRLGKTSVRQHIINTQELVKNVLQNVPKNNMTEIHFSLGELPDLVGDSMMIEQVFVNLLSNAVKYSSKKEKQLIEIGADVKENEVIFFVKDNGAGFDMAHYDKLFGIFKRLHSSKDFEGTGVGLSIVKLVIEKHGGKIWAESVVGEGATFWFSLPKR